MDNFIKMTNDEKFSHCHQYGLCASFGCTVASRFFSACDICPNRMIDRNPKTCDNEGMNGEGI